ncbi:MAG: hypothetical protein AB4080_10195 [Trichodesmium sp.]
MINHIFISKTTGLALINNVSNFCDLFRPKLFYSWQIFAQQVDVDLWADVQKAWSNFIECGQLWALVVGLVIGWMVKSILP